MRIKWAELTLLCVIGVIAAGCGGGFGAPITLGASLSPGTSTPPGPPVDNRGRAVFSVASNYNGSTGTIDTAAAYISVGVPVIEIASVTSPLRRVRIYQNGQYVQGRTFTLGQPDAPIVIYEEVQGVDHKRWQAMSGTVTIDSVIDSYPTLHITGAIMSLPSGNQADAGLATGMFTLDATVTRPGFGAANP